MRSGDAQHASALCRGRRTVRHDGALQAPTSTPEFTTGRHHPQHTTSRPRGGFSLEKSMGYTTRFSGSIKLSRPLTMAEAKHLLEANKDPDTIKGAKPGSYMQWVPSTSLDRIVWDEGEKFYNYAEWLSWLCELLSSWKVEADGSLKWSGEEAGDVGELIVIKNVVTSHEKSAPSAQRDTPLTLERLREMALEQLTNA